MAEGLSAGSNSFVTASLINAEVAQLVEHVIGNDEVPGSIPGLGLGLVNK